MTSFPNPTIVLFHTTLLDFNSTADQAIPIRVGRVTSYLISGIRVYGSSGALATAAGGIYSGTGKPGGGIIVAASQVYSAITGVNEAMTPVPTSRGLDVRTAQTLYLSLTTPEGAARTANILIWGTKLS